MLVVYKVSKISLFVLGAISFMLIAVSPAYALSMEVAPPPSNSVEAIVQTEGAVSNASEKEQAAEDEVTKEEVSQTKETLTQEQVHPEAKNEINQNVKPEKKAENITEEKAKDAGKVTPQQQEKANVSASISSSTTNSITMKCTTPKNGWVTENGKVHYYNNSQIQTGWVVDSSYKNYGLQRYWMGAYGNLITGKVASTDANGNCTYCTKAGYVSRGKFKETNGNFYLSNNDGKLENAGWLVTGNYDGGLQRYYIDPSTRAVKTNFFKVDGNLYHGDTNLGYVIRWKTPWGNGILLADNDGVIYQKEGWLVTGVYDGGQLQRYRVDYSCGSYMGAHVGLFILGGCKYRGLEGVGYVLRNSEYLEGAKFYYANNDGVISYNGSVADRVALIWQNPELPLGCESVAITAILRAWGYNISKTAMNDIYIPMSSWDWVYSFAGNGRSWAINGCMPPAVVTGANRFLSENSSGLHANNIKGTSWSDILNLVREGYPVAVWHTINNVYPNVTSSRDGYPYYPATEHCVVVCGISGSSVKVADSLAGMVWRDAGYFGSIYDACWRCAVVVR